MEKDKNENKKIPVKVKDLSTGKVTVFYHDSNTPPKIPAGINDTVRKFAESFIIRNSIIEQHKKVIENLQPLVNWQTQLKQSFEFYKNIHDSFIWLSGNDLIQRIRETQETGEDVRQETNDLRLRNTPISNGKAREVTIKEETLKVTNSVLGIVSYYAGYQRTDKIEVLLESIGLEPTDNRIRETQRKRNFEHRQRNRKDIKTDLNRYLVSLEISLQVMRDLKISGTMRLRDRIKQVGENAGLR